MTSVVEAASALRLSAAGVEPALELELPADVSAAAVALDDLDGVLAALDGTPLAGDVPSGFVKRRRAEYLAGRHAAASALARLGLPPRVGRCPNGLPAWPPGSVGSITHGAGRACALAGRAARYRSLGVDVERLIDDAEATAIAAAIARPDELFLLKTALPHTRAGQRLAVAFSAKESLFKCLFPLTRVFLELSDVRLVGVGMATRRRGLLALRLERACAEGFLAGRIFQAHFALCARRVESAVLLGKE